MKEIVMISAFTPDVEREDKLRDLILNLRTLNYRVCLITHTSTSQDIVDKCDYFIYDKENTVLYDPSFKYWHYFSIGDNKFNFVDYTSQSTHMLPVFRLYLGGLAYLRSMGEEIVHMTEYDTVVKNTYLWDKNRDELLRGNSGIFYVFDRFKDLLGDPFCYYGFQSVNAQHIEPERLVYDEHQLKTDYQKYYDESKTPIFERLIFDKLWMHLTSTGVIMDYEDEKPLDESFIINTEHAGGNVEYTNVHLYEDKFWFMHHNKDLKPNEFEVMINNHDLWKFYINPGHFKWVPIGIKDTIMDIKIYKNNKLLIDLDLTTQEGKDWVYKYSRVEPNEQKIQITPDN